MEVLYYNQKESEDIEHLRELTDELISVTVIPPDEKETAIDRAEDFDAVIGARIPREFLVKASNLEFFIVPFAGIPVQDKENLPDFPDLKVINSHFNKKYVSELAWALLLASAKKLCPIHNKMKEGDWTPRYEHEWGLGLEGKELLILGYGEVGRKIAKVGKAFDMKVKAVKKTPGEDDYIDFIGTNEDLPDLLPDADFIIVTLPLTDETEGYLGEEEFEMMKDGVHIVNVGRGPVIDEGGFYRALKSGKVAGAGIDTWWIYPPDEESRSDTMPSNYPIHEFDNVVFSPHRGSHVKNREEKRMKDLAEILNSLNKGEIVNLVDVEEGY
ncbi:MAG: 2-hydroxyacid dehydrogenase [Thermoplasmatota archaeon]